MSILTIKTTIGQMAVETAMDTCFGCEWSTQILYTYTDLLLYTQIPRITHIKGLHDVKTLSILLMEDIPNNHLECIKPCKEWDNLPINWCRISSISIINPSRGPYKPSPSFSCREGKHPKIQPAFFPSKTKNLQMHGKYPRSLCQPI